MADGAGGNRSLGINPADFSRAILAACRRTLRQSRIQPDQLPRLILSAMEKVEANHIQGKIIIFIKIEFLNTNDICR